MAKSFSVLVTVVTPKQRWAQFSLRTLLVVTAFICLLLGGRHLLNTYGHRIEMDEVTVGEPIKVKVRYVRVFGPPECRIHVSVSDEDYENQNGHYYGWYEDNKKRSWLCFYTFKCEFEPVRRPCELSVELSAVVPLPPGNKGSSRIKTFKRKTVVVK